MNVAAMSRRSWVLLIAAATGCDSGPGRDGATVRDSVGVMVIEHGPSLPPDVGRWSFEPDPVADLGDAGGDDAYLFSRIVQASSLPGGHLVVADRETRDFRIFDSTGILVKRFGRKGKGPGEFQTLAWVGVDPSGGITAYDFSLRRLSRFFADGTLDKIVSLESVPVGSVQGQFEDGSVLFSRRVASLAAENDPTKLSTGLVRDSIELLLISPDGSSSTSVGRFPGTQELRAVGPGVIVPGVAPFGLRTVIAVANTVFYLSTQESWEIRVYRRDGKIQRIIRRRVGPAAVTAASREAWQRQHGARLERLRAGPPAPPAVLTVAEYSTLPEAFPPHGDLRTDRSGNVWVENYRPFPAEDTLTTWLVFNPEGAILATAELPNVQITEIGTDRVVGVWRDEDDVPHVRVYRLVKHRP